MFQADLLKGQHILITGGGTGLGRSMALRFAELGARFPRRAPRRPAAADRGGNPEDRGSGSLGHRRRARLCRRRKNR